MFSSVEICVSDVSCIFVGDTITCSTEYVSFEWYQLLKSKFFLNQKENGLRIKISMDTAKSDLLLHLWRIWSCGEDSEKSTYALFQQIICRMIEVLLLVKRWTSITLENFCKWKLSQYIILLPWCESIMISCIWSWNRTFCIRECWNALEYCWRKWKILGFHSFYLLNLN